MVLAPVCRKGVIVPPSSRFERDSAVTPRGHGVYDAVIDEGWFVIDGAAPNGGYVTAIAARAMAAASNRPDPITITAHFLQPPQPGGVQVVTEIVREGGRHSTVAADVRQDGVSLTRVLATFGDLSRASGPTVVTLDPPQLPPIEECVATVEAATQAHDRGEAPPPAEILQRCEHRQPAEYLGWTRDASLGIAVNGGYIRWPDTPTVDPFGLLVIADCYPPAVFNLGSHIPVGWAPTIELTVQIRARPVAGWLRTQFTTQAVTNGYLEEDGQIWDADGNLVALSRQTAMLGRAR